MKILYRSITAVILVAVLICITANIKAKADVIEASEVIANNVAGADLTSIAYAYTNLTLQQKLIADYLMGAYNYTYLCARGFSFDIDQSETNMKAQLGAIGERIWQFATTDYAWRSRFNEVFRQYASSMIVYASKQTVSFDTWISQILSGNRNVYIEYSQDALDAWTEFYNDPSADGIAYFGYEESPWESGSYVDYSFLGVPYASSSDQEKYNNFILNNNPVLFSFRKTASWGNDVQMCIGNFNSIPNSLFVLRSADEQFQSFRYGISDSGTLRVLNNNDTFRYLYIELVNNLVGVGGPVSSSDSYRRSSITVSSRSLSDLVDYAFSLSPINLYFANDRQNFFADAYPFISHVYIVDDLNTLANAEEIFNTNDFHITRPALPDYIITPNGKMLIPGYAPLEDPFSELWEVSVDVNGDTVTEDEFQTQIVNNTVINNYTIDTSDKINVPVDWFDNPMTDQLTNDSIPFLAFARDCIDTLGDLQMYFYGAIVIGLGGGVLKKLLL